MLTKKQQIFLKFIINCYNETKEFPTIGYLKEKSTYKSYNTIYKYLDQLVKKDYIRLNDKKNTIIYIKEILENNNSLNIPIINEFTYLKVPYTFLNQSKEYVAFKIHNNKLNSFCIKNKDILIIQKDFNNLHNKLVLVLMEDSYQILKYIKKDGFIHLKNDSEMFFLTSFETIIGKVVSVIRETMD